MLKRMKKFKVGDQVLVTAGKDKSKSGEITRLLPKQDRVVVKGINLYKRHRKPQGQEPGGIIELERPLPTASIMLVEKGVPVRVGLKRTKSKVSRLSKKTGQSL
jgi:large subunit ribosomal protein L24